MGETSVATGEPSRRRNVPQADNWRILRSTCAEYLDADGLAKVEDAYNFAFSMCTVAIVITWAFAAACP